MMGEEEAVKAGEMQIRARYRAKERIKAARADSLTSKRRQMEFARGVRRCKEEEEELEDQAEEMPRKKVMKAAGSVIKRSSDLVHKQPGFTSCQLPLQEKLWQVGFLSVAGNITFFVSCNVSSYISISPDLFFIF